MSDPQLPPPDPAELEQDGENAGDEQRDRADGPAVAGVGPALLAPPLPSTDPEPPADEDERDET